MSSGYSFSVLYNFWSVYNPAEAATCTDGCQSEAGLVQDAEGNLYGTTTGGGTGAGGQGTVFELAPPAEPGGAWTETVLYNFCSVLAPPVTGVCTDGASPDAGLVRDAGGNLYGTTLTGGNSSSAGTVFKLAPPAEPGGTWTETVLYNF